MPPIEEPYDELMGPNDETLKRALVMTDTNEPQPVRIVTPQGGGSGAVSQPPSNMFTKERWAQYEDEFNAADSADATNSAVNHLLSSDGSMPSVTMSSLSSSTSSAERARRPVEPDGSAGNDNSYYDKDNAAANGAGDGSNSSDNDPPEDAAENERIRQDALKMLEVADESLSNSNYSVHRTISGGFMASPKALGGGGSGSSQSGKKRLPVALSGLGFAGAAAGRPYRDDPYATGEGDPASREDFEYGEDSIVDVVGMENRASASRGGGNAKIPSSAAASKNNAGKSWSSRYSVDKTMLALTGGSVANNSNRYLDDLDMQNNRHAARNLFSSAPKDTQSPTVFGSGFSFRKNNVFGKQNVTVPQQTNLRTVWTDIEKNASDRNNDDDTGAGGVASLPPGSGRSKSWQERLEQNKKIRRRYLIAIIAFLVVFITLFAGIHASKNNSKKTDASAAATSSSSNNSYGGVAENADYSGGTDEEEESGDDKVDVPLTMPTADGSGGETFYVTSNVPYTDGDLEKLRTDLAAIQDKTKFVALVGNIHEASEDTCAPDRYAEVAAELEEMPIGTMFVVPGEQDWNNCPNPDEAWDAWHDAFTALDTKFQHDFYVSRQVNHEHNWFFIHDEILFLGLHIVNGQLYDWNEAVRRGRGNLEWLEGVVEENAYRIKTLVVFANARPGEPHNQEFFDGFSKFIEEAGLPTAYVHGNDQTDDAGPPYSPYPDNLYLVAIQAPDGSRGAPPLRIRATNNPGTPFEVGEGSGDSN